jgi:hypothetical protein
MVITDSVGDKFTSADLPALVNNKVDCCIQSGTFQAAVSFETSKKLELAAFVQFNSLNREFRLMVTGELINAGAERIWFNVY